MTDVIATIALGLAFLLAVEALRWTFRPAAKRLRRIKKMRKIANRHLIIIGTSGADDYLPDQTGQKRFWPVVVPHTDRTDPLTSEPNASGESGETSPDVLTKMEY